MAANVTRESRARGSGERGRGNLPAGASSFLGREAVFGELAERLDGARLTTLTGPAGIGKSRLGIELAHRVEAHYPDGAWLVELAPIGDEALVPGALASALSIDEVSGQSVVDTLSARLKQRNLLLVVDNCEHLLEACGRLVETLLGACAGLTVLATSREPLGIAAESVWQVPPLSVPDQSALGLDGDLLDYEAVGLFLERARAVEPGFALNDYVGPAIAEICRRLDGIPLAIELAAVRVKALTPAEIARRLDDRFALLADESSELARHRTLATALDWSYQLLSASEQTLLRRASVFAGGFEREAASSVCAGGALEAQAIAERLDQLVVKSLLVPDSGRYRMLETIRAYGTARLEQSGEVASLREAHAHYYMGLAKQAEPELEGSEQVCWLERLEREYADLRAALEWSLGHGGGEWALELAGSLVWFWRIRGHFSEGRGLLEAALSASDDEAPALKAKVIWGAGLLTAMSGEVERAIPLLEESVARYRELDDPRGQARALLMLANSELAAQRQDTSRGRELAQESAALAREAGDAWCLALALFAAGYERMHGSEFASAEPLFEQCAGVAREAGDREGLRWGLLFLGQVALLQGDDARAEPLLEEAMSLGEELGDDYGSGTTLQYLGALAMRRGDLERACDLLDRAIELLRSTRPADMQIALVARARVAGMQGDRRLGGRLVKEALALAAANGEDPSPALLGMGELASAEGNGQSARRYFEEALDRSRARRISLHVAKALEGLGRIAREDGDRRRAGVAYGEALTLNRECANMRGARADIEALAGLAGTAGRAEQAARLFGAAHALGGSRDPGDSAGQGAQSDADLALVRAALGGEDFDAAFAEGTQLSIEQAVTEAARRRGRNGRPRSGWESLTEAEHNVAALVAEGMTNQDVAARLFITRDTVKTHLSHIYAKLGISRRGELAKELWRHREASPG